MEKRICKKCGKEKPLTEFRQRHKNPDRWEWSCKKCRSLQARNNPNRETNVEKYRKTDKYKNSIKKSVVSKYGLTVEEYNSMVESVGGLCEICRQPETRTFNGKVRALSIEHCHLTNKVRGIVCDNCNTALARTQESIQILESMIEYLKRNR